MFRGGYNELGLFYRNFSPGRIKNEQIYEMFGRFRMERISKPFTLLKSPSNIEPLKDIQSILLILVTYHLEKTFNQQVFLYLLILGRLVMRYLGLGVRFVIQLLRLGMLLKIQALHLDSHLVEAYRVKQ